MRTKEGATLPRVNAAMSSTVGRSRLLTVDRLRVEIGSHAPVEDVSFTVQAGSIHCLVGDSGSGKSLSALASVGLLPRGAHASGSIRLDGVDRDLLTLNQAQWSAIRGRQLGYVGQNALGCLHPAFRIRTQLAEAILRHQSIGRATAAALVLEHLDAVDLADPKLVAQSYPAELSGGMCQRVAIAMALCNNPSVLIADEPTTALDDETQGRILELIQSLVQNHGLGVLLITHDQSVVDQVGDATTTIAAGISTLSLSTPSISTPGISTPSISTPSVPASPALAVPYQRSVQSAPTKNTLGLEVTGVSKDYRSGGWPRRTTSTVLTDVSFSVEPGTTVGLVGRSGAGKTTLAKIIAGVLPPTQGSVCIAGRPMTGPDRVTRRERADLVQYVFQNPFGALNPRRSVITQVAEPLIVAGEPADVAHERAHDMLRELGLDAAQIHRPPTALSGGQCQRVGISRALIRRPAVVVLDEPVSALDWSIRDEIIAILAEQQAATGALFVLISHERALVERESDQVIEVIDGTVQTL